MKGLIALIILVVAVIAIQMYALPALSGIQAARDQLAVMEEVETKFYDADEERKNSLSRLASILPADLARLDLLLPKKPSPEELYVFFNTLSGSSGMRIENLSVTESVSRTASRRDISRKSLDFDLEILGSYENFRRLMDGMENNIRLMDITKISVAVDPESGDYKLEVGGVLYYGN
jgi:Tfp pilus assembly protein PilO